MAKKKFAVKTAIGRTAPALIGGVAVGFLTGMLADKVPDPKIGALIPVALGAYLAATDSGKLGDAGLGMIGAAGPALLKALGVPGIGAADDRYFSAEEVDEFADALVNGAEDEDEEDLAGESEGFEDDDDY